MEWCGGEGALTLSRIPSQYPSPPSPHLLKACTAVLPSQALLHGEVNSSTAAYYLLAEAKAEAMRTGVRSTGLVAHSAAARPGSVGSGAAAGLKASRWSVPGESTPVMHGTAAASPSSRR